MNGTSCARLRAAGKIRSGTLQYRIAGIRVCGQSHAREVTRVCICRPRAKKNARADVSTREKANFAGLPQQSTIANQYAGGGGGHGGNTVSTGDTVINNGKYKKACKVNGGNYQDAVSWQATVNGEIIKSYCPWVWQNANRKKHCKQMQNNVLVSTACPCACAGY